jgi:transposase
MQQQSDIGRSTAAFVPDETLVIVLEMSRSTWLVAGLLPGVDRRPLKKLQPDENALMRLLAAGARRLLRPVRQSRAW